MASSPTQSTSNYSHVSGFGQEEPAASGRSDTHDFNQSFGCDADCGNVAWQARIQIVFVATHADLDK
jgi:hypothetical protein